MNIFKKSGEKVKIGNREACVYTKGKAKTKYIKKNKEYVLLSKCVKRGGNNNGLFFNYSGLTLHYKPKSYSEITNKNNPVYENNISVFENPMPNIDSSIRTKLFNSLEFCSDEKTKEYINNKILNELKFANEKISVVRWDIADTSMVLIIGDIHGDAIALENIFNSWYNNGFMTKDFKLHENIYVISTGDLIDYGTKNLNVLCAMLRLRKENEGRVMLLCGNHETSQMISGRITVAKEYSGSYNNEEITKISKTLSEIHLIGPDMLALHFGNEVEGTYFMHGMYPILYDKNTETYSYYPKDEDIKEKILTYLIQWNDVTYDGTTKPSQRGDNISPVHLGSKPIAHVMNEYKIKGFIRGHQDNCGTHIYPYKMSCENTYVIKNAKTNRACRNDTMKDAFGWCSGDIIKYQWTHIPITENLVSMNIALEERVLTTSTANEKSNTAPIGSYLLLTVVKVDGENGYSSMEIDE
jgi:hypothetical protein